MAQFHPFCGEIDVLTGELAEVDVEMAVALGERVAVEERGAAHDMLGEEFREMMGEILVAGFSGHGA